MKILGWMAALAVLALVAGFVLIARPFERQVDDASALIVLAGQSNALGFGLTAADLPPALQTPDPQVKIWDGSAFVTMQPGVNTGSPGAPRAWGPEVEFARLWRADHPDGVLHIVKHARGSTALAADAARPDWSPASDELYAEARAEVAQARDALRAAQLPDEVEAVLWMQGEQDAVEPDKALAYGVNLVNLFVRIRRDWTQASTPIIFGQVHGQSGFAAAEAVRTAQAETDQADDLAWMTTTDGLELQPDGIHLSADGQIGLGAAFYALYAGR